MPKESPAETAARKRVSAVPAKRKPEKAISPALPHSAQIVMDSHLRHQERISALKSVSGELSLVDRGGLSEFLRKRDERDNDPWQMALKNSVMDYLCRVGAPGIQSILAEIFRDRTQNPVLRDYALQHLAEYAQHRLESGVGSLDAQGNVDVLWEAINETDSSIAGTAIMGLYRLSSLDSRFDPERVAQTALTLTQSDTTGDLARTAAIQVCARMNVTGAVPAIRQLAQGGSTIPLQVSSIAALGLLDDQTAAPYLTGIASGNADALKPAAQQALAQLVEYEHARAAEAKEQIKRHQGESWKKPRNGA